MHIRQSWTRFLPSAVVNNIATLGPLGYASKAPGTVGSLAGVFWFTIAFHPLGLVEYLFLLALTIYLAMEICGEAEQRMLKHDPGEIILDEFVAIPICFIGLKPYFIALDYTWLFMLGGFVLFRIFDIFKPFGIKKLQHLPGGVGVVADDLAAALGTCLTIHGVLWLLELNYPTF